jgi:hypothetical protein
LYDALSLIAATAVGVAIIRGNPWMPTNLLRDLSAAKLPAVQEWANGSIKMVAWY